MIGCLISLIIVAIIALIVVLIVEAVIAAFFPLPANVMYLIRLLVGLLVLLYALNCILGSGIVIGGHLGRW